MRVLLLCVFLLLPLHSDSKVVTDQNPLIGSWKLVSFAETADDGKPQQMRHPSGYLIVTPDGRMMVVMTAPNRKVPASDADRAELFSTMQAYTGKYRFEGNDFVTTVDVAKNPGWVGTEQRRHYKLEGGTLTMVTAPYRDENGHQRIDTLVWEREM